MLETINFEQHDTHLLIGFPGETDDDIENTLNFLHHHTPRYILLSHFMPCKGTAAATMDGIISYEIARQRIQHIVDDMQLYNVVVNYDNSKISQERRERLAKDAV